MTDTKLKELIETLKKQGVESGEEASRQIIEEAKKNADQILAQAKSEAEDIVSEAKADADKRLKQLQSSMEIAASQFVTNLKKVIETNLITLPLKQKLDDVLDNTEFLQVLLTTCIHEYVKHPDRSEVELLVSKEQQEKLVDFAMELIRSHADKEDGGHIGLNLQSDGVEFGFMIGKIDGTVKLDFTDDAFLGMFLRYLSPRFREFFKNINIREVAQK
ncbi:MAG: hypothetical protein HQK57_02145 [Deltaproteobacteria bacterium]|nr:hypothetical protein [Deltaproteobacteria bacterium]MBF0507710.1 hypothetical protein [Deltaproteobacteria bacterium]